MNPVAPIGLLLSGAAARVSRVRALIEPFSHMNLSGIESIPSNAFLEMFIALREAQTEAEQLLEHACKVVNHGESAA